MHCITKFEDGSLWFVSTPLNYFLLLQTFGDCAKSADLAGFYPGLLFIPLISHKPITYHITSAEKYRENRHM